MRDNVTDTIAVYRGLDRHVVRAQQTVGAVRRRFGHAGAGRLHRRWGRMDVAVYRPFDRDVVRAQPVRGAVWQPGATYRCPVITTATASRTSPCTGRRPGSGISAISRACSSASRATSRCRATTTATARADIAVYRPSTGFWFVRNQLARAVRRLGRRAGARVTTTATAVTDIAVYRPSTGRWFVRNLFVVQFGDPGDVPVVRDRNP